MGVTLINPLCSEFQGGQQYDAEKDSKQEALRDHQNSAS